MEGETCHPGVAMDSGNPLLRAVFLRRLRLTRLLLEGGAYINESDSQGQTPLMVACRTQHADPQSASRVKLVQFLLEKGADPNIQDQDGRSALMHACREHAGPEAVSLLLAGGADIGLEDQSGTSALAYAVVAGDWTVLKLLLDACKSKGKEVIIITTDQVPPGDLQVLQVPPGDLQVLQHLHMPLTGPRDPPPLSPASPSDVQLITSPRSNISSLCPPKTVFSFKEGQMCGVGSHPCSPSRFRGLGESSSPSGQQQPLLRLNSEPWLKVPASLLHQQTRPVLNHTEKVSLRVPRMDQDIGADCGGFRCCQRGLGLHAASSAGLLLPHSSSHPNLHSETLGADPVTSSSAASGTKNLASSSLHSIIQRRQLGADIYRSDPQLAGDFQNLPEEQRARDPMEARRLAPLRCASVLGSRESLLAQNKKILLGYERRGSGTFLLDRNLQARPRSLPPLSSNAPVLSQTSGLGSSSSGQKHLLPSAPPGHPKEASRRTLLRRHSMQTEQFKGTA